MKEFVLGVLFLCVTIPTVLAQSPPNSTPVSPSGFNDLVRSKQVTSIEEIFRYKKQIEDQQKTAVKQIAPNAVDEAQYKNFLRQPKTGIVRLVLPKDCAMSREERLKNMDKFAKECPTIFLKGGGSNFSFRKNEYNFSHQADITIDKNVIFSMAALSQGIMVRLGDVSLEDISLQSEGVKFLADFVPAVTAQEADKQTLQFMNGLQKDNYNYAKGFKVVENTTFALRVVAYKADVSRDFELSSEEFKRLNRDLNTMNPMARESSPNPINKTAKSDPLYSDERKDIIVAFRIIKVEADGSVTLLWRELQSKDSPKMSLNE